MSIVFLKNAVTSLGHESKDQTELIALRSSLCNEGLSRNVFELGKTLGTGSFGRVRIVTYVMNGKKYYFALKILRKSEIIRLKQVNHIKAEKNILTRVNHPFIVNLNAAFQDRDHLYMLMEYVIGGELFTQLRKVNRFSDENARFYAAEIVLAFEYLHAKNIVYRDLKPENLLIDKDGHIKITDFGFAKHVENRTYTLCGTPEYLAPEIITSKGHGKPVDWWAVGILIYEMLCGAPPFDADNPVEIYQKILKGVSAVDWPSRYFNPTAKDLISSLLKDDITLRCGCTKEGPAEIKRHAWFNGLDWDKCVQRKLRPPFIPAFKAADDTSNFDYYPDSDERNHKNLGEDDLREFDDF
mmetsp:Transcript_10395/g.15043  ORF Transcript_10395/g.15043 Transcript_10395/m.15043 type:complete len:355 (+) Transcript_10395:67-1131(+)|eukprot:CAMPEP_0175098616 /NCGR_PEP_ID=MMETSP0086_2-20121207/5965_1 /TAXON_ID=136419 /ORGANISM="Unknown Unknown, Strain D1" /LENGTH=354 /DNA_ID=CAMNT_0016372305 /DNA_START=71 /DNA_END=1135 /DNA_ORIENTATION=+